MNKHVFAFKKMYESLYKHLKAHIGFLEMYGKWACIHELVSLNSKFNRHC
jgi:hypothetical protein